MSHHRAGDDPGRVEPAGGSGVPGRHVGWYPVPCSEVGWSAPPVGGGVASNRLPPGSGRGSGGEAPVSLAADLLMIMLDGSSGRLWVRPRLAGYALAGALLIERWAALTGPPGTLRAWSRPPAVVGPLPVDDPLWSQGEAAGWSTGEWLEVLATVAVDRVGAWLVDHGWVFRHRALGLTGRREVLVPAATTGTVYWRPGRLAMALAKEESAALTGVDLSLALLLDAVGFARQTTESFHPWADRRGPEVLRELLVADFPEAAEVCGWVQVLAVRAAGVR